MNFYSTILARCVIHNLVCVIVNYIMLKVFGSTLYVTAFLFAFQLGYLSVGKYLLLHRLFHVSKAKFFPQEEYL